MQNSGTPTSFKAAILELERKQAEEAAKIKEQLHTVYESIQPINILKNTFKEVGVSDELKHKILNATVGLAVGAISKRLFEDQSRSPIKELLGTAIMFCITTVIAKIPNNVIALATSAFDSMLYKSRERIKAKENQNTQPESNYPFELYKKNEKDQKSVG